MSRAMNDKQAKWLVPRLMFAIDQQKKNNKHENGELLSQSPTK